MWRGLVLFLVLMVVVVVVMVAVVVLLLVVVVVVVSVVWMVLVEGLGRIGQQEGARSFVPTPLEHRQHCHITIIIIISATTR